MKIKKHNEGEPVEAGFYYAGMSNDEYHGQPNSVSKSSLDLIDRDPYYFFNNKQKEQTRPMEVGSAIHAAILEPEVFELEYMLLPEIKDRRQPEYKDAVKALGAGKVFAGTDCENITNMQNAVWGNDDAKDLLTGDGYNELSGFAADPETGIICRHRFDRLKKTATGWRGVDVKKTQDVSQFKFSRSIHDYRYHVQAAFYSDQFEWITGTKLEGFSFIAVEEKWPHRVAIYELDDISVEIGRTGIESHDVNGYRQNLNTYADCLKNRDRVHNNLKSTVISLPDWVLRQYEEDLF